MAKRIFKWTAGIAGGLFLSFLALGVIGMALGLEPEAKPAAAAQPAPSESPEPVSSVEPAPAATETPKPVATEAPKPATTASPKPAVTEAPKPVAPQPTSATATEVMNKLIWDRPGMWHCSNVPAGIRCEIRDEPALGFFVIQGGSREPVSYIAGGVGIVDERDAAVVAAALGVPVADVWASDTGFIYARP